MVYPIHRSQKFTATLANEEDTEESSLREIPKTDQEEELIVHPFHRKPIPPKRISGSKVVDLRRTVLDKMGETRNL